MKELMILRELTDFKKQPIRYRITDVESVVIVELEVTDGINTMFIYAGSNFEANKRGWKFESYLLTGDCKTVILPRGRFKIEQ